MQIWYKFFTHCLIRDIEWSLSVFLQPMRWQREDTSHAYLRCVDNLDKWHSLAQIHPPSSDQVWIKQNSTRYRHKRPYSIRLRNSCECFQRQPSCFDCRGSGRLWRCELCLCLRCMSDTYYPYRRIDHKLLWVCYLVGTLLIYASF